MRNKKVLKMNKEKKKDAMVYLNSKKNANDGSVLVQGTNVTDDNTFSIENYDNFLKQYESKLND